jgi:regulatory protein
MIVTKIERQKNHPGRFSLFVDGAFAIGLGSAALLRAGLRRGDEITPGTLERLGAEDELDSARASGTRFAGRRRRTEHEIRAKLSSLSFSLPAIESAVEALRAAGLVDDRAYVRAFVHDAGLHRPAGGRLIIARLRGKGIPADVLSEELSAALGPEEEARLAKQSAARYLPSIERRAPKRRPFLPGEREAMLRRYLAGRGFSAAAIDGAVRSAFGRSRDDG